MSDTRLKGLLRQWLADCGVFRSDVDRRDGTETWRCAYCDAKLATCARKCDNCGAAVKEVRDG